MPPGASKAQSLPWLRMGKADFHLCGDGGRCPGTLRQGRIHPGTTGSETSATTQSSFTKTHLMCPVRALPVLEVLVSLPL